MIKVSQVAEAIRDRLKQGFKTVDDYTFNEDFNLILNGVHVERTSYKDTYYLSILQVPFFTGHKTLRLTYRQRFRDTTIPRPIEAFQGSIDAVADKAMISLQSAGLLETIRPPFDLNDLLDRWCDGDIQTAGIGPRTFDLACASLLLGQVEPATACLRSLQQHYRRLELLGGDALSPDRRDRQQEVEAALAALDHSEDAFRRHIRATVARNARQLGIQAPAHPPDSPG